MHELKATMKPQPFRIVRLKRKSLYDQRKRTAYFEETTTTIEFNLLGWAVDRARGWLKYRLDLARLRAVVVVVVVRAVGEDAAAWLAGGSSHLQTAMA